MYAIVWCTKPKRISFTQETKVAVSESPLNIFRKGCLGLQDDLEGDLTVRNSLLHPL